MKLLSAQDLMRKNMLVKMLAGSHAYGTNIKGSDVDYRGIFLADPINIRTPFYRIGESTDTDEEDTKFYELSKFFELCSKGNPNILELLWTDRSDIEYITPAYEKLRENRDLFLSSKVAFTYSGYAMSQLKRIKGHKKWINNPQPKEPPKQIDFLKLVQNFQSDKKIFKIGNQIKSRRHGHRFIPYGDNVYGVYQKKGYSLFDDNFKLNTIYEDGNQRHELGIPIFIPLFIVKFCKQEYNQAKEKHKHYWIWKKNRNEKRSELEEKYSYDSKFACHLVRLLRQGEEILTTGKVLVKRPDAEELIDIRNGAWTYEELIKYAEEKDEFILKTCYKETSLPKKPDLKKLAELLMDMQDMIWRK